MRLDINTNAVVKFTATLEQIRKSAMVKAARFAINSAAFDAKTKTMPAHAGKTFEKRSPNFFKANSRVEKATGTNLHTMKAVVGFTPDNLQGKHNHAVKDLQQQESGGRILGRSFVPLSTARKGNSYTQAVRPGNRLSQIKRIINAKNSKGKTSKQKFVKAALAAGPSGYVLSRNTLFRVNSLMSDLRTKNTKFKVTPLYSYRKSRNVKVAETRFMQKSSIESAKKMEDFYISEAKKQIDRLR
jgi:hypothetical protein